MSISGTELTQPTAQNVTVSDDILSVDLADGRTITVPLAGFRALRTERLSSGKTSASSETAAAFTGPNWTKTSASKACWRAEGPARRKRLYAGGWLGDASIRHSRAAFYRPIQPPSTTRIDPVT
jgi:hypothetical protein